MYQRCNTYGLRVNVCFFQWHIDKEENEILYWVFSQTKIPSLISEQRNENALFVEGFGEYTIKWHMARDLKILKYM